MIQPLNDQIVVEKIEDIGISDGGIVLPDSAKQESQFGKVVAVGAGKQTANGGRFEPLVSVEDIVCFPPHAGKPITVNGTTYHVMIEAAIYGILT